MQLPENIHADLLPSLGGDLAGGKLITLYMVKGVEYALAHLGAAAEVKGPWGEYGQDVATTNGDGLANTRAMAEAGSSIAIQALEAGAFIPSIMECHLLMHAKEAGVITDLHEDRFYWSSSQFSADIAYSLDFDVGWQDIDDKCSERFAPLVRRIPIIR